MFDGGKTTSCLTFRCRVQYMPSLRSVLVSFNLCGGVEDSSFTFEFVLHIQGDVQRVEWQHRIIDQAEDGFCCHL